MNVTFTIRDCSDRPSPAIIWPVAPVGASLAAASGKTMLRPAVPMRPGPRPVHGGARRLADMPDTPAASRRAALVTGGAQRIGRAIALALAQRGYAVARAGAAFARARPIAWCAEIMAGGGRAAVVDGRPRRPRRGAAPRAGGGRGGRPAHAARQQRGRVRARRDRRASTATASIAISPSICARRSFSPRPLRRRCRPAPTRPIVNLLDQRVFKPTPRFLSYGLTKSALHAATTTLAQALAPRIRVNAVAPGPTLPSPRQDAQAFAPPGARAAARSRSRPAGHRRGRALSRGRRQRDRRDHRGRRRPASRLAHRGCRRGRGIGSRLPFVRRLGRTTLCLPWTSLHGRQRTSSRSSISPRRRTTRRCPRPQEDAARCRAAATRRARSGPAAPSIARYAKLAPTSPGVYRMIGAAGEVLYVGKAKSLKKRVLAYARPTGHDSRIARMIAATDRARVRLDRDRDRGAAARGEPDQAAAPALQRAAARRQVVSLHPHHRRPRGAADPQAPRRAQPQGRLLRAVRGRQRGQPHHHGAGARLPDPLLLGRGVREPHAALPAAPDQALLGAVHRRDLARRLCRAGARGEGLPVRPQRRREGGARPRDGSGERGARLRARRRPARPARGARGRAVASGHQSARRRGGRRVRGAPGRRLHLRRGVLLPHRTELGQPRLFPQGRPLARAPARCWARSWPSSTTTSRRRAASSSRTTIPDRALLAEALTIKSGRKVEVDGAAARREEGSGRPRLANAREALGRKLADTASQQRLLAGAGAAPSGSRAPPRRIEVYDNSHIQGTNAVGAMIVAGPEGFRKNQYRKFNIRSADLVARRRLRHDARGAHPPVQAADRRGAARAGPRRSRRGAADSPTARRSAVDAARADRARRAERGTTSPPTSPGPTSC